MALQKLLGLLLLLMMGNLSFVGSHLTCPLHAGMAQTAPSPHMPAEHHHGGTGSDKESCHFPSQTDTCQGVASCSGSVSLASVLPSLDLPRDNQRPTRAAEALPLSRLFPPDPPPPKA